MAGVALGDNLLFTWQAWHKLTSTVVLRGRRGTHGTGWRAWSGFVACDAAALCVAGVALGDIHLDIMWQAWHKLTSTVILRGRPGTHGTGWRAWSGFVACDARGAAPLCMAGVALGDIHLDIVAGVAQSHIHCRFAWQAPHSLCHPPSLTHHLSHKTLSHTHTHTIFHTPLCHTPSLTHLLLHTIFVTHHLSPHHLPHTIFQHTIFHTQLCHTPSSTHHVSHTTLSHTTLSHTIFFHHTIFHTPSFSTHYVLIIG